MTMKKIRTKTRATGGITNAERSAMMINAKLWIQRAMRTDPIEADKIIPAIKGIYAAAGLAAPRVIIVPSPLVMAFAYGAAATIYATDTNTSAVNAATRNSTYGAAQSATYDSTGPAPSDPNRHATYDSTRHATYDSTTDVTNAATYDFPFTVNVGVTDSVTDAFARAAHAATRAATGDATYFPARNATNAAIYAATRTATRNATNAAIYAATRPAPRDATHNATRDPELYAENGAAAACMQIAGNRGLHNAKLWEAAYQGGNMWAGHESYLTATRDVLGLDLPEHVVYAPWEQAAIHGGFRVMHEKFCIVSDFPCVLKVDDQNRSHCANGPSHMWRDGWALYYWHGVKIPSAWILNPASLTAEVALNLKNLEQRRAAIEIIGWATILRDLNATIIDEDGDPQIGTLVQVNLPDLQQPAKFLRVTCGTGREFAIGVPPYVTTALDAQAWMQNDDNFTVPEIRT